MQRYPSPTRRTMFGVLAATALTAGVIVAMPTQAAPPPAEPDPDAPSADAPDGIPTRDAFPVTAGSQLRWKPDFATEGLDAFEGVEDDRKRSHGGVKHIFRAGEAIRFEMHTADRDGSDRQRSEVKGMSADGEDLEIREGETWRITYSMFIPDSLKATSSFTHIMQMKVPGTSVSSPLMVMSLRRDGDEENIELKATEGDGKVGSTPLDPLRNKWIDTEVEITAADQGKLRWVIKDGGRTVFTGERDDVDVWAGERLRPKWGIYRSVRDRAQLEDTHLLLANMRAYQVRQGTP